MISCCAYYKSTMQLSKNNESQVKVKVEVKRIKSFIFTFASTFACFKLGGGERVRTDDLLRARQALSQLSYTPDKLGGPRRTRTSDLTIISRVL